MAAPIRSDIHEDFRLHIHTCWLIGELCRALISKLTCIGVNRAPVLARFVVRACHFEESLMFNESTQAVTASTSVLLPGGGVSGRSTPPVPLVWRMALVSVDCSSLDMDRYVSASILAFFK